MLKMACNSSRNAKENYFFSRLIFERVPIEKLNVSKRHIWKSFRLKYIIFIWPRWPVTETNYQHQEIDQYFLTKYYYTQYIRTPTYFKHIYNQSEIDMTFIHNIFLPRIFFAFWNFVYFCISVFSDKKLSWNWWIEVISIFMAQNSEANENFT